MNEDEKPIEGVEDGNQSSNERPAGQVEGSAPEPSTDEVKQMYEELGIKAPVPTGKSGKRPKANDGGGKKASEQDDASGKSERQQGKDDGSKQSKASSASDSDGKNGNGADSSGAKGGKASGKDGEENGKVSKTDSEDEEGVSGSKSSDNGKTPKSGEDGSEEGNRGAGDDGNEQGSEAKKESEDGSEEEQGKRPGKSNPEVEKRMQRLAAERKEALERAEAAEKKLQEATQKQEQAKIAQEDPEYTIDDFRKVRDNKTGEILELNPEQAELAWRRWKDGYDARAEQRQAKQNYAARVREHEEAQTRQLMDRSVKAYDALAGLMDEYPELVSTSGKFDEDFAAEAMPIIQESIEYLPGTEPGNPDDNLPVIIGLRIDPNKILKALKGISTKKRSLPLNGVNDNTERPSGVSVPHGRSSDPNIQAANELYKELGIDKRL